MKKLFALLLCLLPFLAHANTLVSRNNAGGEIILTAEVCEINNTTYPNLKMLYTTSPSGEATIGCWYYSKTLRKIHAAFPKSNSERLYDPSIFEVRE